MQFNKNYQIEFSWSQLLVGIAGLFVLVAGVVFVGNWQKSLDSQVKVNQSKGSATTTTTTNKQTTTTNKQINELTNIGTVTDEVIGGFYMDIGNSIDEITIDQSALPGSPEEFTASNRPSDSAHTLIKIYEDGRREVVPFTLGFCPPYTDVCRGTTEKVDLAEQNYSADVRTLINPSITEVRIKINNTLAETIRRPQEPPKITSISKTELNESQLQQRLSEDEYEELNTKRGTLIEWEVKKGSFETPQVVALHKPSRDQEDQGWSAEVIDSMVAGTATQPRRVTEFLATEDTITYGAGKFDFKLRVSDGFHLVTAEREKFFSKPLNPIGLKLASPQKVYLRSPFFITIDEFTDPVGSVFPDKRTVFYERDNGVTYPSERRSVVLPSEYQIEWSSQTLPLETVAQPIRKSADSPAALRISIPQERQYTDLLGSHTITARVTNSDVGITQTATTTVELTSLSEACAAEEIQVRQGCARTRSAD